jgi:hypothetical protein
VSDASLNQDEAPRAFNALSPPVQVSHNEVLDINHVDYTNWQNQLWQLGDDSLIEISNGSLLAFSGIGTISKQIRAYTKEDNPLLVSHVGIALVGTANEMIRLIERSRMYGGLRLNANVKQVAGSCEYMLRLLGELDPHKVDVFCLHSTGSHGVHIAPLNTLISEYVGHMFVRSLHEAIPLQNMIDILTASIGNGYNFRVSDLVRSVNDKNKQSNKVKQFCSQLVAETYKDCGIIPKHIVSMNVTPAEFYSGYEGDLLANAANKERMLKVYLKEEGCTCSCRLCF